MAAKSPYPLPPVTERREDWPEIAHGLIRTYNACADATKAAARRKRPIQTRPTPENHELFYGLFLFCQSIGVTAEAWIYAHFAATGFNFPIRVTRLFNTEFRAHFEEWSRANHVAAGELRIALNERQQKPRAPSALQHGPERAKRTWMERDPELCYAQPDLTLGYNRLSPFCVVCPLRVRCEERGPYRDDS